MSDSFKNCEYCNRSFPVNLITKEAIISAQQAWAAGVVSIGDAYANNQDYKQVADNFIEQVYGYNTSPGMVLFKPTKASHQAFRQTKEGALSYFIGQNSDYPEDSGFALMPWSQVEFLNDQCYLHDSMAVSMGVYIFTSANSDSIKVEYTLGYVMDPQGKLKIVVHHSSLPYAG